MYRFIDGSVGTVSTEFFDDNDVPLIPAPGYPRVQLLDTDKSVLAEFIGSPAAEPGNWEASISIPLLGVEKTNEYRIKWRFKDQAGNRYKAYDNVLIDPKVEHRESEIVMLESDDSADLYLPFRYIDDANTPTKISIFAQNNDTLGGDRNIESWPIEASLEATRVELPNFRLAPSLVANILFVRAKIRGRRQTFSYRYWVITPQIALAATQLEAFLNKSRIENIIPELEWTTGDLLGYLERGLYLFNMTGMSTGFNGLNMQGPILDSWIICSAYWAISSQLLAEGSLAFDFSGQGISLNVDRTPQLDSALGRIEARIQDTVVPLKKQLATQGLIRGDGSVGATSMRNPFSAGTLGLTNSPTTRVNGFSNFLGRRF